MCYNITNGGALETRMVQSLEEYIAQATKAYQPTSTAIQAQIDALPGQLQATNEQINRNYAQQQAGLNRQRNMAAETASMQAAGSGGSFGGAANIANRKYYDQTFVPAVTQLRANQTNELAQARQANEDAKLSLAMQKANAESQANQQALAQYYSDVQAEQNRALQRAQIASQNAYNEYLRQAAENEKKKIYLQSERNMYGGFDWVDGYGNKHTAGTVASSYANGATSGDSFNESLYSALGQAARQGDYYSSIVADQMYNDNARFAKNNSGRSTGNAVYDTLGIYRVN